MIAYISQYMTGFLSRNVLAAVTILTVAGVRLWMKRLPKKYSYALWSLVGIRMIFDIQIPSPLSILNLFRSVELSGRTGDTQQILRIKESVNLALRAETWSQSGLSQSSLTDHMTALSQAASSGSGNTAVQELVSQGTALAESGEELLSHAGTGVVQQPGAGQWFTLIWLTGVAILLAYAACSWLRVRRNVRFAVPLAAENGVYETDRIPTAFILGILAPRIYIPCGMNARERAYILCHERYHLRRGDMWFKALAFLLLCLYWVNPLAWLAFYLFSLDMEMSCDEAVLSRMGMDIKKEYSMSLLSMAAGRNYWRAVPLGFGESDAGKRIRHVLYFKRPKVWMHVVAAALIVTMLPVCLTKAYGGAAGGASDPAVALHRDNNAIISQTGPAGSVAATDQGLYFAEDGLELTNSHGYRIDICRLLYFDGATETTYIVCSDSSCTHDTAACQAVYKQESISPLGIYEGKLYILGSSRKDSMLYLYCSDPDGQNRELLWQGAYASSQPDIAERRIIAESALWSGSQVFVEYYGEDLVRMGAGDAEEAAEAADAVMSEAVTYAETGILCIDMAGSRAPVTVWEESSQFGLTETGNQGQLIAFHNGYVSMMAVRDGSVYYRLLQAEDTPVWADYLSEDGYSQWNSRFTGQILAASVQEDEVSIRQLIDLGQGSGWHGTCYGDEIYYSDSDRILAYDLLTGQTREILALEGTALETVVDGWVVCRNYQEDELLLYQLETGATVSRTAAVGDNLYGSIRLQGQSYWFLRSVGYDSTGARIWRWYLVDPEDYLTDEAAELIIVFEMGGKG